MTSTATGSLAEHPIAVFATRVHAVSTGAGLASQNCQPRAQAHQDVRLAVALDEHCLVTRDALAAGTVDLAQARVIVGAVEALREQAPEALMSDATLADHAERHLVGLAAEHDAAALRRLGRHVLEVVDPGVADLALGQRLEADEATASRATSLELFDKRRRDPPGPVQDLRPARRHAAQGARDLHQPDPPASSSRSGTVASRADGPCLGRAAREDRP